MTLVCDDMARIRLRLDNHGIRLHGSNNTSVMLKSLLLRWHSCAVPYCHVGAGTEIGSGCTLGVECSMRQPGMQAEKRLGKCCKQQQVKVKCRKCWNPAIQAGRQPGSQQPGAPPRAIFLSAHRASEGRGRPAARPA